MTKIEGVLFDLDGTLLDTAPDFATVINIMLRERGMEELSEDHLRKAVSNGAKGMISLAFGWTKEDPEFMPAVEELREIYANNLDIDTVPFPGIEELLMLLEGCNVPWGVVTNKPSEFTLPLMESLGYSERASSIVCPNDVKNTKPDPESVLLACSQMGVNPGASIFIGDHIRDIQAGQNAGMDTIVALYGYIDEESDPREWNATHYATTALDIIDILKNY